VLLLAAPLLLLEIDDELLELSPSPVDALVPPPVCIEVCVVLPSSLPVDVLAPSVVVPVPPPVPVSSSPLAEVPDDEQPSNSSRPITGPFHTESTARS
jgi:hypothetical protein